MLDLINHVAHGYWGYLHTVQHWAGKKDHSGHTNFWNIYMYVGIFVIGISACISAAWANDKHKKTSDGWAGGIRGIVGAAFVMLFWPYIYWSLVPFAIAGIGYLLFWAFVLNVVPSKAERIARKELKAETLRGQVADARKEMA